MSIANNRVTIQLNVRQICWTQLVSETIGLVLDTTNEEDYRDGGRIS